MKNPRLNQIILIGTFVGFSWLVIVLPLGCASPSRPTGNPKVVFAGLWRCDAGRSGVYDWDVMPDRITAEFQNERTQFSYTLDRSHTPHWLDIGRKDEPLKGILEFVDANTFRVTVRHRHDARPSEFTTDQQTLVFKRVR